MRKLIYVTICFVGIFNLSYAQQKLTLKQAVETGITNNLGVRQSALQMQKADINLKQSRAEMLPNLNLNANHGINQGRSINPFTNSYVTQNVDYASYGISTNVLLFNGLSLHNLIQSNGLGYSASKMELQQQKDNLTINIILDYLQVLSAEEILQSSKDQAIVTAKQVDRLGILNQAGSISPSVYYDLKGQQANDEIAIADNEAAVETAKLNLAQLMNIPYDKNMEVEPISIDDFDMDETADPAQVYQTALQGFAEIKAVHFRTESSEKLIRAIKGQLYPTLTFGVNANTNYSSIATQSIYQNSSIVASPDYVVVNGANLPVMTKSDKYNIQKIPYGSQLSNNLYTTFNLGLSIPIFNNSQVRSRLKAARLDLANAQLNEQTTKTVLQQSIERAYLNLTNTGKKYRILLDQVKSFTESYRSAEIKFESGVITSVDYLVAKNNLDKARTNLITAKYDYVLREKILDYYQGKPLW
ncbi:MAG: TolC family protein [Bacteroidota bacterium]|nr:TolC family protein [Bacteroidota bacterium]